MSLTELAGGHTLLHHLGHGQVKGPKTPSREHQASQQQPGMPQASMQGPRNRPKGWHDCHEEDGQLGPDAYKPCPVQPCSK